MSTDPARAFSWRMAILLVFGVGLLVAVFSIILQTRDISFLHVAWLDARSTTTSAQLQAPGVGSSYDVPGAPVRLIIPSIGVDAKIQSVGLSPKGNGDMGIPSNFTDVAWYNKGPLPGAPGSAVIDGHLDGKNKPKAVFFDLGHLKPGDEVHVIDDRGRTLHFRVVRNAKYDYNATTTDIFYSSSTTSRLNLITCAGDWMKNEKTYNERIVVFTELVEGN